MTKVLGSRGSFASFVIVSLIGSFWEELCFRSVGFVVVTTVLGGGTAACVFLTSAVFAIQHLRCGPLISAYSFCFGLLFAAMYCVTGELYSVVVAHAVGNVFVALNERRLRIKVTKTFDGII